MTHAEALDMFAAICWLAPEGYEVKGKVKVKLNKQGGYNIVNLYIRERVE